MSEHARDPDEDNDTPNQKFSKFQGLDDYMEFFRSTGLFGEALEDKQTKLKLFLRLSRPDAWCKASFVQEVMPKESAQLDQLLSDRKILAYMHEWALGHTLCLVAALEVATCSRPAEPSENFFDELWLRMQQTAFAKAYFLHEGGDEEARLLVEERHPEPSLSKLCYGFSIGLWDGLAIARSLSDPDEYQELMNKLQDFELQQSFRG